MSKRLSTERKVFSAKIETKMSPNVSNTSTTTVSLNLFKNSSQSLIPFSPKVFPTTTLF
ncbi:unnamed protein product [Hymenolepis diminuta]|uniref:Uncharacterized protein n=1 Tax=Hymenolepis diminuta TaxID=6216 RepID=A0A564YYH3_HYMDI|nr:unnamed protein product [Hymenolepis diminuta]